MTLTEFLLARIAEDEAVARGAIDDGIPDHPFDGPRVDDGHWSTGDGGMYECRIEGVDMTIYDEGGHTAEQAQHIARHDPARVLAECEAKRRIVELHSADHECTAPGDGYAGVFAADGTMPLICPTMLALASAYADHPGYRAEWKP